MTNHYPFEIIWQETIPLQIVSPNIKEHWKKKWTRNKQHKSMITALWLSNPPKAYPPCDIVITRISPRELDYDNLVSGCKAIRDTIADLITPGLPPGRADNNPLIHWYYLQEIGKKNCKITILQK